MPNRGYKHTRAARRKMSQTKSKNNGTLEVRFFRMVTKTETCWVWKGKPSNSDGYGRLQVRGKAYRAHRVSWVLHYGPIPRGMSVLHSCDNPRCVNPVHLFIGTQLDNMADKVSKGRQSRGENQHAAKLTIAKVRYIRKNYRPRHEKFGQKALAEKFGVSTRTISLVVRREVWAWI